MWFPCRYLQWHKCGKQRFFCKSCGKTFLPTTYNIMSNSHFPADIWREVIKDTVHGNTIDYTAQRMGCSHQAVFDMRHKVLMSLQQLPEISEVCLGDISEFDETFVLDCYKGKNWKSSFPEDLADMAKKRKKGESPMNMCISAQASSVKGMQLPPLSTAQNPAQRNWLIYLKAISQTGHPPFATDCKATMYFRGLRTAPLRTAMTRTGKIPAFIT